MIKIHKTKAPREFNNDLAKGATIYPNHLSREGWSKLREKLLDDQGFICCYCQRRIPHKNSKNKIIKPKSKIEHFKCQDNNPALQLVFKNMFIACNGNILTVNTTCDSKKGNKDLRKTNLLLPIENNIYYTINGQIISVDNDLNQEINDVLNLNDENLKKYREAIVKAIKNTKIRIGKMKGNYGSNLKNEIKRWESRDDLRRFKEFKGVGLYFLKK